MVVVHSQDLTKSARTHADSETLVSAPRISRESMVQMVDGQIAQIILSHLPSLTDCFLLSFSWAITIWRIARSGEQVIVQLDLVKVLFV